MAKWLVDLPDVCNGYNPRNIANCDETALFFRMLPSKTMSSANETCSGGKLSKERLTLMLTVFGDGAISRPLIIGKSAHGVLKTLI